MADPVNPNSSTDLTLTGHVGPDQAVTYHTLPFEMPPGVSRLDVSYTYSAAIGSDPQLTGGNTVDIGLFDQRGEAFLNAGFRGWSGSARQGFFVTPTEATPGYLPGPLEPGRWYIGLGFYKIASEGCQYQVDIRFTFDAATHAAAAFPPLLTLNSPNHTPPPSPTGWYRGELHCHTWHSDGDSAPEAMIAAAKALGLDFLAITDHNCISHRAALQALGPQPLILIPGSEVTTYKGHWNVWGLEQWIDFRTLTPERLAQAIRQANDAGYLTSCNHPRTYGPPWAFPEVDSCHCVEVWNGPWELFNHEALAFWERLLRQGKRRVAVGGSDAHFLQRDHIAQIGTPTTWIYCPGAATAAGLLAGLRAGHACISRGPDGPQLTLSSGEAIMGDVLPRPADGLLPVEVRVVDGQGLALELHGASGPLQTATVQSDDQTFTYVLPVAATPYVRAQLVDATTAPPGVHALTNPLYLQ